MSDYIETNNNDDGVDRRGFLKCMAWAGTGMLYTMAGGLAVSRMLGTARAADAPAGDFTFVQISDSRKRSGTVLARGLARTYSTKDCDAKLLRTTP